MPMVVHRVRDLRPVVTALCLLLVAGYAGIWVAPTTYPWLWAVLLGLSAALVAVALAPEASGYLIAGHDGVEAGIAVALRHLGLTPVLGLDLRLGEGSGAVAALLLVAGAAAILRDMATFDSAGVSGQE